VTLRVNIEGQKFGKLTAIHDIGSDKTGSRLWKCLCECGQFSTVAAKSLRIGKTKSC